MRKIIPLAAALVATTALTTTVYALDKTQPPDAMTQRDFGKLIKDGHQAMNSVRAARWAIFDAKPDQARKDVENAMRDLKQAKTADVTFLEAEADLKPPANVKQPGDQNAAPSKNEVAWLPIDGVLTINDDLTAIPAKASAVKQANEHLKAGEKKAALDTLKASDVNVSFTMAVVPFDTTTKAVDQASQLIDQGKYYEANQSLMMAENGLRYDVLDINALPQKNAASTTQAPAQSTTTGKAAAPKDNAPAPSAK